MRSSYRDARIVHRTKRTCVPMRTIAKQIIQTIQTMLCTDCPPPRTFPPTKINSRRPVSESLMLNPPISGSLYSATGQHSLQLFKLPSPAHQTNAVYKKIVLSSCLLLSSDLTDQTKNQQHFSDLHTQSVSSSSVQPFSHRP